MQTELKAASELCVEFLKMVKFFLKCDVYTIGKISDGPRIFDTMLGVSIFILLPYCGQKER